MCLGPSRIQTDFAAMSLGSHDNQPKPIVPKPYETTGSSSVLKGKSPEKKIISSPSKTSQTQVKKSSAPAKVESSTNPFDEDDDTLDSNNPFASGLEEEGKTTNPFDEPDDYDKEKNPFGCS